jgi:hypothetical protein
LAGNQQPFVWLVACGQQHHEVVGCSAESSDQLVGCSAALFSQSAAALYGWSLEAAVGPVNDI